MLKCQSLEVSLLKQLTSLDDTTIGTPAFGDPKFALGPLDVGHGDLGRATMKHGFPLTCVALDHPYAKVIVSQR